MAGERENIVKEICKELNITQKELSEILRSPANNNIRVGYYKNTKNGRTYIKSFD